MLWTGCCLAGRGAEAFTGSMLPAEHHLCLWGGRGHRAAMPSVLLEEKEMSSPVCFRVVFFNFVIFFFLIKYLDFCCVPAVQ